MPYQGKPSTGCLNCKNRRIKCDETRPRCRNCLKTRRDCPGYTPEVDLIFRDEGPSIQRRVKRQISASVRTARDAIEDGNTATTSNQVFQYDATTTITAGHFIDALNYRSFSHVAYQQRLNPPIEHQATFFWFHNCMLPPRSMDSTRGLLNIAAPLYASSEDCSPVRLSVQAAAMAVVSCWPERQHLAPRAAQIYGKALLATHRALQSRDEATTDGTLLAILLFQVYETISSSDRSITAWGQHLDGAVAIVRARGVQQFESDQSLNLFRSVRTLMLQTCTQRRIPVIEFPGPKGWLSDLEAADHGSRTYELLYLATKLPDLLSEAETTFARSGSSISKRTVEVLLQRALAIQRRFLNFETTLPAQWSFTTTAFTSYSPLLRSIDTIEAWPGPIHAYTDVHISSIRNNNRVNQILCSCVVVDALKHLDPKGFTNDERYKLAARRVQTLVDEVCYSVPFHLWGQEVGVQSVRAAGRDREAAEGMGAFLLVWPLYTCSTIGLVPDIQRRWMRGRLKAVAKDKGFEIATILRAEPDLPRD